MVLMSVPADPTVSFSLSFAVGSQDDPPGKEGLAFLTGEMLADAATEKRSLDQILEALYPLASSYSVRVDRERTTLTGRTHRDNVAAYFELFSDAFLKPAFKATDFERVKNDAINELENTLRFSSDEELGKAAFEDFVFRGTRYAHPSEGTVEGLRSITLDDVRAFYKSRFTARERARRRSAAATTTRPSRASRPRSASCRPARRPRRPRSSPRPSTAARCC